MEGNGWRPAQGEGSVLESGPVDWRSQLQLEARQGIVNEIMETLKRHLLISDPEGLNELKKIAVRFEEKIYTAATSQSDYLRQISLKMLPMETKTQHTSQINPAIPNAGVVNQNSTDPTSLGIPAQVGNPGQSLTIPNHQSTLTPNLQSNTSAAVQCSSSLPPSLPSVAGFGQSTMNSVTQASNLENMTGVSQGSVNNSVGQGVSMDIYAQRQMQGRQQQLMSQQQQSQNPQIYQHQLHQQMLKHKLHSSLLQQQQQSLMPPNQLQSSPQPLMQMSSALQSNQSTIQQTQAATMQSASQPGLQQNQIQQSGPSLLQQHPQAVARQQQTQTSILQQTPMQQHANSISQQSSLSSLQQELMGQQGNMTNIQHAQLLGQQINIADMQQQQQRLPVQQTNLLSMQQQQQMMNQQNLSLHQQHQLASQSNMSGLQQQQQHQQQQQQQQQLLGFMPNVSNMQSHPRSMLLQKSAAQQQQQQQQQQTQQTSLTMMQSQGQLQSSQQQLMSQFQSQPPQLQQQLSMQQQSNSLQCEIHQRLQASNTLFQTQNTIEQKPFAMEQKQFMQQQRTVPVVSSSTSMDSTAQITHAGITDWQEECYQKIQSMKEMYFTELNDFHQKIAIRLQKHEALMPPGKPTEQYEKLKNFKTMLERTLTLLQISKVNIPVGMKEKLPLFERQIMSMLASNRFKKVPPQPQGQQFQLSWCSHHASATTISSHSDAAT